MAEYLKLRTKDKNIELRTNLDADASVVELLKKISEVTEIPVRKLKVLCGYPRKQINVSQIETLEKSGIKCGDTLFIEEDTDVSVEDDIQDTNHSLGTDANFRSVHIADDNERIGHTGILLKKEVPSDNSCLFTSIEFAISGKLDPSVNVIMRGLVADTISSLPDEYNEAILGKPIEEYCNWIINPNSWGGAIEIAVLSNCYGFEIAVVNSTTGTINRFGEDKNYQQRFFLLFDGIHYDPLYMDFPELDRIQTIFSTANESVLHDAQQLALEAKGSRQFTDINQLIISCKICNSVFVGQLEAQNHARATGHTVFDEVN